MTSELSLLKKVAKASLQNADVAFASLAARPAFERGRLVSLMFHSIFASPSEVYSNVCDPQQRTTISGFRNVLAHFQTAGYQFVGPEQILAGLNEDKRYVWITFDDGYFNNSKIIPVLEEMSAPATIFVCSGHVLHNKAFWWDVVFRERSSQGKSLAEIASEKRYIKPFTPEQISCYLVSQFGANALDPISDLDRPLTSEELRQLAGHPLITIGNHTRDHAILASCDDRVSAFQVEECQNQLAEICGFRPLAIAYPNGDWSTATLRTAAKAGLRLGVTTAPHGNRATRYSPMLLGRHAIVEDNRLDLQCAVIRAGGGVTRLIRKYARRA